MTAVIRKVIQSYKKSLEYVYLEAKIYWNSSATVWNSKTIITIPKGLTSDFTDFLKKCLNKDERDRWSAPQLLEHTWIKLRMDHLPVQSPIQSTEHYIIIFNVLIATSQYVERIRNKLENFKRDLLTQDKEYPSEILNVFFSNSWLWVRWSRKIYLKFLIHNL